MILTFCRYQLSVYITSCPSSMKLTVAAVLAFTCASALANSVPYGKTVYARDLYERGSGEGVLGSFEKRRGHGSPSLSRSFGHAAGSLGGRIANNAVQLAIQQKIAPQTPQQQRRSLGEQRRQLEKNKNRLFITLQHRFDRPGFHWAILLAPKSESGNPDEKGSHLFHAINSFSPGVAVTAGQKPGWRYESKPANVLKSHTITARVLVAKLPGSESVEAQAQRIDSIIRSVPLVQNNDSWTCRTWVKQALEKLKASGGDFASIPVLTENLEKEIITFAEKAKEIVKGKMVEKVKDLAQLDMRGR
ncbi:hypothetical protein M378DRAFT_23125 [Amanita muscaria Koide BX008]|uniref:Uncharacterized protein n=1 Tax=Amanita muscaria (strain Koide BX008) TaxID=946122 RepID=A0A0C2XBL7_AMAMK|nr:hypothetical protein M378DRAFT_23125 [Amanita muscaria Koide BX008]